jgi:hypothetical protein
MNIRFQFSTTLSKADFFHSEKRELELISFNPESEIAMLLFIHFFCHRRVSEDKKP